MNTASIFWLTLAIVLGVIEASTVNLITIWFAISALITSVLTLLGANASVSVVVFIVLSAVLVIATRPLAKRFLLKKTIATNADRIISADGIVVEEIDAIKNSGQVKVMGQIWSAKSSDGSIIEVGTRVTIKDLEGVKAIVDVN